MAKLPNLWLKGGSQKLGGVVLYQAKGQTLARELAAQVSNPRTDSQMEQRVKLANVVGVYRANRNWMAGAFEDKKQNESDYNAFVRANLANSLVATSKPQAAAGAAVVAPYKVSSGSLPVVEHVVDANELVSNLYLGDLTLNSSTTVAQLSQALINNNNGMREGMQLSLIVNVQQQAQETGIPYIVVRAYEMILNLSDSRLVSAFFNGVTLVASTSDTPALAMGTTQYGAGAATFIISETMGGKTRVSTQSLVPFGSNTSYQQYTSQEAWAEAIRSYGANTTIFLDSNTASGNNVTPASNYIEYLTYDNSIYRQGSTIVGGVIADEPVSLVLNRAAGAGAEVTLSVVNQQSGAAWETKSLALAQDGLSVSFAFTLTHGPEYNAPMLFTLNVGGEVMTILINVTGDIS